MIANAALQEPNLENYIILHRKDTPDILVSETITDQGLDWYKTHEVLHQEGFFMPTPRQFFGLLKLLQSPERLYDGMGKKLSTAQSDERKARILDDILTQREPWRAEHLDAYFVEFKGKMYIRSSHRTIDKKLEYLESVPLEKCVIKDCYVNLTSMNGQGLPTRKLRTQNYNKGKNIYFRPPVNNSVARFWAVSGGAVFNCFWNPQFSLGGLGARRQKFFER